MADSLLAALEELNEQELRASEYASDAVLVIDNDLRTIAVPSNFIFGVYNDKNVLSVNFEMPRTYDDVDLSGFTIQINYLAPNKVGNVYEVTDPVIGEDKITFEWLLDRGVFLSSGTVEFTVCLREIGQEGAIIREFNTTIAKGTVLAGLEIEDPEDPEAYSLLAHIKQMDERVASQAATVATDYAKVARMADEVEATAEELEATAEELEATAEELADNVAEVKEKYGTPLVAPTAADMIDHTKIYVYTGSETGYTFGNWYYWDGSAWTSGGVYNSAGVNTDSTLSVSGMPADAKKTGDEISGLKEDLSEIEEDIRDTSQSDTPVTLDIQTDGYYANNGVFNGNDTARAYAIVTTVTPGDVYLLSTFLRPNSISAILYFNSSTFVSVEKTGSGSDETVTDYQFTIPSGVNKLIVQSANNNISPELILHSGDYTLKFYEKSETYAKTEVYNKIESDERYAKPSDINGIIDDNAGDGDTNKTWSADKLDEYSDILLTDNATEQTVSLTISTTGYYQNNGVYTSNDTSRAHATVENVSPGESFLLTSFIRPTSISAILYYNGATFISYEKKGSGSDETLIDYQFTIPSGANKVIVQSADKNKTLSLKKIVYEKVSKSYTKAESDLRYGASKYGVRWSVSDASDEGERCFGAVGLSATIGIGSTDGSSDFDSIYPWREIKRCNIKKNANGADVVTYEGETGFALDGTNGDVFVRIPKFYVERYISDGYEYRVITDQGVHPHEAFIENGAELDEIFISAFEGYIDGNSKMRSQGGVIPSNNVYESAYLNAATANGDNYSLYDMRCVDAIWTLMAVEFGKRNSNKIIGWGLADFMLPLKDSICTIIESGTNVNSVKVSAMGSEYKALMPVGSSIQICSNNQQTILTQAKLTNISDTEDGTIFTFDGDPVTVDTDCFIGSAPMPANSCESVSSGALAWHTGRANFVANSETRNPIRYRWIENPVGNVWHCLPDITFLNGQMFVCKNMTDYEFLKHDGTKYTPIGKVFEANTDNGNKGDVTGYNYWITSLAGETFAKYALIGRSYDKSLLCGAAFGGYYYMYTDRTVYIVNGGGFDHKWRCNMLTNRAWITANTKWFLYGARMMYKHIV